MNNNRIASFDGLRGIAAFYVVAFHCFFMLPAPNLHYPAQYFLGTFFKYGWLGVHLFFIISGFVISFTLYKYNNVKQFMIARFARLYPTYWAAIIFSAILTLLLHKQLNFSLYLTNFLMFQQLLHVTNISGVFWTLSFELTFYVIAMTIFYFGYFSKHKLFIIWGAVTLAWQIMSYIGYVHPGTIMSKLGYFLILQFSPLFIFGVYLHKAFNYGWNKSFVLMMLAMVTIFIALLPANSAPNYNLSTCRILLGVIFMLSAFATRFPENKFLTSKVLVFFGKISYSWYLIHLVTAHFIFNSLSQYREIIYAPFVSFFISIFFSILFTKYIERPSHNFVLRVFKMKKRSTTGNESINTFPSHDQLGYNDR